MLAINTKFVITSQDLKNTNKCFQQLDLIHKEKIRVLILLLGFWLVGWLAGWLVGLNTESHYIVLDSLEMAMLTISLKVRVIFYRCVLYHTQLRKS